MRRNILIAISLLTPLFLTVFLPLPALAAASISLSPYSGMSGTSITVSGGGFSLLRNGYVWFDSNNNGVRDAGEPNKSVRSTLFGNIPSGTTLTVPEGIAAGIYQVRADIPTGGSAEASSGFTVILPVISASAGANGSISPSGDVPVIYGADQSFTITADDCYHVAALTVDGNPVTPAESYTFTSVKKAHAISATFAIDTFALTYTAGEHGSISGNTSQIVNCGASGSQVTAAPVECYHFVSWNDGVTTASRTDSKSTDVTATFAIDTFSIAVTQNTNGTISPDTTIADCGAEQRFTVTAGTGYHIADVIVDGVSAGAVSSYEFTNIAADHTIEASFAADRVIPGWDLNDDGICNIGDVIVIGLKWGQTGSPGWITEDVNPDGIINIGDIVVIGLYWGQTW